MTLSLIAPVIVFGGLAQITPSGGQWTTWELLGLVVVGLILFVALTGLLVLLARQAPPQTDNCFDLASRRVRSRPTHAHGHRGRLVHRRRGPARGIDPDASASDSIPPPPAP